MDRATWEGRRLERSFRRSAHCKAKAFARAVLARWVDRLLPTASCHAIEASWHDSADPARMASNYDHVRNDSTGLLRATCQREAASDGVNCRDHAARRAGKESRHAARICCHLPRLYASRTEGHTSELQSIKRNSYAVL